MFAIDFRPRYWLIALCVVVVIVTLAAHHAKGLDQTQFATAKIRRSEIRKVVEASGTINALTTVQVGSQVSGTIARLYADFNSRVTQGQVIAQIDPVLFRGTLLQTKADLSNMRAALAVAQANLEKAKLTAAQADSDHTRAVGLSQSGIISAQALYLARTTADTGHAAVDAADAEVKQAKAQVEIKEAAVTVAQANLDYTTIRAPINGIVIARNVDVGQTVAASLQAPTLFTIAQDLTKMQLYANTDEADVGMIQPGQVVTFKVDAYPNETYVGRVADIRLNATTSQNVVTYSTVIDFANPQRKLFPAMTAYIDIPVATARNVICVPNMALRFRPDITTEQAHELFNKYHIDPSKLPSADDAAPNAGGAAGKQFRASARNQAGVGHWNDLALLWKLRQDHTLEPVIIGNGITDQAVTEVAQVLQGELQENDVLITGSNRPGPPHPHGGHH